MNCFHVPCQGFRVFTGPRAAAVVSRISRRASEKKLYRLLRHFPDAGMVAVSGIVSPCKDANIEIIYKSTINVKKNLSTIYPPENVDNVDKVSSFAQTFGTICGKIKFSSTKYCILKVIHISTN